MPHSPVSPAQRGIWINELAGSGNAYRMPLALTFEGPLDVGALLDACSAVLARHELLGAAFQEEGGEVRLVRAAVPPPVRHGTDEEPEFDLARGPLAAFTLTEIGPQRHRLLFTAHHLVFDGMSKDILVRDLAAAYAGRPLGPAPLPYAEAVRAEQERVTAALDAAAEFWRDRWHDPAEVLLPGGRSVASRRPGPGGSVAALIGPLIGPLTGPLTGPLDPAELGVTPFELLVAALHAVLYRYGDRSPSVAVDLSTRTPESAGTVGLFVNELPVASRPAPELTVGEFARQVRAELRAVYRFREVPLAAAVGGLSPRGSLTPVSVSYRRRGPDSEFPGLTVTVDWAMPNGGARGPLHLQAVEGPGTLEAWLRYDRRVITADEATLVAADLRAVLACAPDTPLAELPLPSAGSAAAPARAPEPAVAAAAVPEEIVAAVTEIFREVLRLDEVGPDEDLFDLGGHSITIIEIIARVSKLYQVELPMDVFFDEPTVLGVAGAIAEASPLAEV